MIARSCLLLLALAACTAPPEPVRIPDASPAAVLSPTERAYRTGYRHCSAGPGRVARIAGTAEPEAAARIYARVTAAEAEREMVFQGCRDALGGEEARY